MNPVCSLPSFVMAVPVDCGRLMFAFCWNLSWSAQSLRFPLPIVVPIVRQTTYANLLADCMIPKKTNRRNILKRRTAHTRSPCIHRSGQKKSAESGASKWCSASHSAHTNCWVRSIFGAISLYAIRKCRESIEGTF